MARTINEIYNSIITEKNTMSTLADLQPNIDNSQTLLTDLTSSSKVAIWRLWAFVVAVAINLHEVVFDRYSEVIEIRASKIPTGTVNWYYDQSLLFQYTDVLTWDGLKFSYPTINSSNQIIKLAAVIDQGFQTRVKVAKLVSGVPTALSVPELTSFQGYWDEKRFSGTSMLITSTVGDDLNVNYSIQYDALLLASDGSLLTDSAIFPVVDAINNYIKNLDFNGKMSLMKMTDSVQNAVGVLDATLNSAESRHGTQPFVNINRQYTADAGYLILASSTINYSINV